MLLIPATRSNWVWGSSTYESREILKNVKNNCQNFDQNFSGAFNLATTVETWTIFSIFKPISDMVAHKHGIITAYTLHNYDDPKYQFHLISRELKACCSYYSITNLTG